MMTLLMCLCGGSVQAQGSTQFERILQIGAHSDSADYVFGVVADAAFGSGNRIYVLDGMNFEVRVFSLEGRLIRKFGRAGAGPGEFGGPTRLLVHGGVVRVLDGARRRVVTFTEDGRHVETKSMPSLVPGFDVAIPMAHGLWLSAKTTVDIPGRAVQLAQGSAQEIARRARGIREESWHVVAAFSPEAGTADTLLRYDHGMIQTFLQSGGVSFLSRNWGSGGGWRTAGDSLVALVDAFRGNVRVLKATPSGFRPVVQGRVPLSQRALGPSDWAAVQARLAAENRARSVKHLEGPLFQPQLGEPVIASDGTIWIPRIDIDPLRTSAPAGSRSHILVPIDGRPQSTVALPEGFTLRDARADLVLGTRRIEHDVMVVEVMRRVPAQQSNPQF